MTYVDQKIINGEKYDKLIINDYLRTITQMNKETVKKMHNELILDILNDYNSENINLNELLKFDNFESYQINIEDWDDFI
jgi:hypothetical protein